MTQRGQSPVSSSGRGLRFRIAKLFSAVGRHVEVFRYIATVILPNWIRTGKRPVIFSRFAGMGDIVCTLPAALELKKRHPGSVFIYNCHDTFGCLPKGAGVATQITSFRHIGLIGYWYRFTVAGFYHFAYGDEAEGSSSSEIMIKEYGRRFGVEVPDTHPAIPVEPSALAKVKEHIDRLGCRGGPLIVIHPGPSWPVRKWSRESWMALVDELKGRGFASIIQVGAGVANYVNAGAEEFLPIPNAHSLVNQLSLMETMALISLAQLYVGIDSGILHLAACVRTPAVGIFGPTTPALRFAPGYIQSFVASTVECRGCHHRVPRLHWESGCPYDIKCMKSIEVGEVLRACLSKLEAKP